MFEPNQEQLAKFAPSLEAHSEELLLLRFQAPIRVRVRVMVRARRSYCSCACRLAAETTPHASAIHPTHPTDSRWTPQIGFDRLRFAANWKWQASVTRRVLRLWA